MRHIMSLRVQDLRVALRTLAKSPTAAALSVLSIALGIGLTTGVFSLADAIFLRPLAIDRPSEVLTVMSRGDDGAIFMYAWPDYKNMRASGAAISDIAAYQKRGGMLGNQEGGADMVLVSPVTPNFFSMLGLRAAVGQASVEPRDGRPAAVIGSRLWQRRFGGDPGVVGKTIIFDGKPLIVAGVLRPEFTGLARGMSNDIWVSTDAWFDVLQRGSRKAEGDQFEIIVRLKAGATARAVAAQLDACIRGEGRRKPAPKGSLGTALEAQFAPGLKKELIFGGGLVALLSLVLFVACANVAQLRLAQAEARRKEIGVRQALGAGHGRIVGQLLLETALLAIPGAALGVLLAQGLLAKAVQFVTTTITFVDPAVRLDMRVLAFTTAATVFSVFIAGMAPARHAVRIDIFEALKTEQGVSARGTAWRQRVLVIGQVAVSIALFGTTLLFVQGLRTVTAIQPGFDTKKQLLIVSASGGRNMSQNEWAEQVCERLAALPGSRAATYAMRLPLSVSGGGAAVRVELPDQGPRSVKFNSVAGNYFGVMGTRIIAGRGIDANDRRSTSPVVVVSRSFAQQFLAGRNPLGATVRAHLPFSARDSEAKLWQVVGVAEDAPWSTLHENVEPFLYFSYAQVPVGDLMLFVETANQPASLAHSVTAAIRDFDRKAALYEMKTLERHMDAALVSDRLMTGTATTLGFISIGLMAAGLFGVLQYGVTRRTRELGLRMALGAAPRTIHRLILGEAVRIAMWGIPVGVALLAVLSSVARSAVVGVSPFAPLLYILSVAGVAVIILCAAWLPARRATSVDPMDALRAE